MASGNGVNPEQARLIAAKAAAAAQQGQQQKPLQLVQPIQDVQLVPLMASHLFAPLVNDARTRGEVEPTPAEVCAIAAQLLCEGFVLVNDKGGLHTLLHAIRIREGLVERLADDEAEAEKKRRRREEGSQDDGGVPSGPTLVTE